MWRHGSAAVAGARIPANSAASKGGGRRNASAKKNSEREKRKATTRRDAPPPSSAMINSGRRHHRARLTRITTCNVNIVMPCRMSHVITCHLLCLIQPTHPGLSSDRFGFYCALQFSKWRNLSISEQPHSYGGFSWYSIRC